MILGDLSLLADGAPVEVAPATEGAKLTGETPAPDERRQTGRRRRRTSRTHRAVASSAEARRGERPL